MDSRPAATVSVGARRHDGRGRGAGPGREYLHRAGLGGPEEGRGAGTRRAELQLAPGRLPAAPAGVVPRHRQHDPGVRVPGGRTPGGEPDPGPAGDRHRTRPGVRHDRPPRPAPGPEPRVAVGGRDGGRAGHVPGPGPAECRARAPGRIVVDVGAVGHRHLRRGRGPRRGGVAARTGPAGPVVGPEGGAARDRRRHRLRLRGRRGQGAERPHLPRPGGRVLELVALRAPGVGGGGHVPGLERLPGRLAGRLPARPDRRGPPGGERPRRGAVRRPDRHPPARPPGRADRPGPRGGKCRDPQPEPAGPGRTGRRTGRRSRIFGAAPVVEAHSGVPASPGGVSADRRRRPVRGRTPPGSARRRGPA